MYIWLIVNTEKLAVYCLLLEKASNMYELHMRKKSIIKIDKTFQNGKYLIPDINSLTIFSWRCHIRCNLTFSAFFELITKWICKAMENSYKMFRITIIFICILLKYTWCCAWHSFVNICINSLTHSIFLQRQEFS